MFWKATSKQLETVPCKDMCRSVHVAINDEVEMDWVEKEGGERRRRILARDIRNNWGKYILIIILNKDGRSPRRWTQNALSNGNVSGGPPTNNLGGSAILWVVFRIPVFEPSTALSKFKHITKETNHSSHVVWSLFVQPRPLQQN